MDHLDAAALWHARIELAAACRWAAALNLQTGICNHFSVLAPGRPDLMLVNPEGYFWSEVTASNLVLSDLDGGIIDSPHTVELTAFNIHAPIHRALKKAGAVLHTHMPYATGICVRDGGEVRPIYASALSFYRSIAYDRDFAGGAVETSEGDRLVSVIGDKTILMMQNHGPLVIGETLGEALLRLLYLEDTCRIQILAEAGSARLREVPPQVLDGRDPANPMFKAYAANFMAAVVRKLSREQPAMLD